LLILAPNRFRTMCGISGILNSSNLSLTGADIVRLNDMIKHRGPDDEGYVLCSEYGFKHFAGTDTPHSVALHQQLQPNNGFLSENISVALGHRRLSVIDLSADGHQPMIFGPFALVFNGEIYNYIELRSQLRALGHQFVSASDTEVVLHAYAEWGTECFQYFNGMWALAIYDLQLRRLFVSRDRLGVKPFYYFHHAGLFAFASEAKALHRMWFVKSGLNEEALFDYLVLSQDEVGEETMFKNILELAPGHSAIYQYGSDQLDIFPWCKYRNGFVSEPFSGTLTDAADEFGRLFYNAVRLRLRADVPVGSCLSGGLDSTAIVTLVNDLTGNNTMRNKVFTASFPGQGRLDEYHLVQQTLGMIDVDSFVVTPTSDEFGADFDTLITTLDVPFWSSSSYLQFRVMKLAHEQGIKVLLDGQGADELFAGYPFTRAAYWMQLVKHGRFGLLMNQLRESGSFKTNLAFLGYFAARNSMKVLPEPARMRLMKHKMPELKFLNSEFLHQNRHRATDFTDKNFYNLNDELKRITFGNGLKKLLRCEDRNSMHFSIESRTPFADDNQLIDFAFSLPDHFKIDNGYSKLVIRESMRNKMPESIRLNKIKTGFESPQTEWIKNSLEYLMDARYSDSQIFNTNIFNQDNVRKLILSKSNDTNHIMRYFIADRWIKLMF